MQVAEISHNKFLASRLMNLALIMIILFIQLFKSFISFYIILFYTRLIYPMVFYSTLYFVHVLILLLKRWQHNLVFTNV